MKSLHELLPKESFKVTVQPEAPSTFSISAPISRVDSALLAHEIDGRKDETVELNKAMTSLSLKNLTNCIVKVSPVKTSIFIENCKDCIFHLAGKQVQLSPFIY